MITSSGDCDKLIDTLVTYQNRPCYQTLKAVENRLLQVYDNLNKAKISDNFPSKTGG